MGESLERLVSCVSHPATRLSGGVSVACFVMDARCAGLGLAQAALLGLELPVVCLELVADAYANGDRVKLDVADLCAVEEHVGLNPDLLNVNVDRPFLVNWNVKTGL